MIYVFDIDGTICEGKYEFAIPKMERIHRINMLYDEGHYIKYFTARGMGRHKDNANKAYNEFYSFTEKQLRDWGCKYHELIMGKPSGDFYIDDKGMNDGNFFDS